MKRSLLTVSILSLLCVACHNEDKCTNDFRAVCKDGNTREVCTNGKIEYKTCPEDSVCRGGKCICDDFEGCCLESEKGEKSYQCFEGSSKTVSKAMICGADSEKGDGFYSWKPVENEVEICVRGCDDETGKCFKNDEKEGQSCDDTYKTHCEDNKVFSCDENKIFVDDCSDAECLEPEGDGVPFCANFCKSADKGKSKTECIKSPYEDVESHETLYDYYYVTSECIEVTDKSGKKHYVTKKTQDMYCEHGCDKDGCKKLHHKEYTSCDESVKDSCDNNIALYCNGFDDGFIYEAEACEEPKKCHEYDLDEDYHIAGCYEFCTAADVGKERKVECGTNDKEVQKCTQAGDKYIWDTSVACSEVCTASQEGSTRPVQCYDVDLTYDECTKIEENFYLWQAKTKPCEEGCDSLTDRCYVPKTTDECKHSEFIQKCDGASVVSCMEGKRIKEDCTKTTWTLDNDYFKGTLTGTCVEDEEEVYCDFACKPEEESQHRAVCDEDNWLYGYRCVKLQTGTYYWKYYQEYCSHGCNGTHDGCVRLHEDEGKPCDDSYQSKCVNNLPLNCSDEIVSGFDCSGETPVCSMVNTRAACSSQCSEEDVNNPVLTCETVNTALNWGYMNDSKCVKEGSLYSPHMNSELCYHGCENDHSCHHIDPSEGKYCDSSYHSYCDNNILHGCDSSSDKTYILDCTSIKQTCVSNEEKAECVYQCTQADQDAGTIKDVCVNRFDGQFESQQVVCVQSSDYEGVHMWSNGGETTWCENGCNLDTGRCIEDP